ncbi:ribosome biogenesis GTPase Der [Endozoicomonadaceae bacterium StTr2]
MVPVIALVGRPNVGKSTLFNRLTRSRDALVADYAGLTRDRKYGEGRMGERDFVVIDTGGISGDEEGIDAEMASQSLAAIEEADVVFFMVDARAGLTAGDEMIAHHLRRRNKLTWLVANKMDTTNPDVAFNEFYSMGIGEPVGIAAAHGKGVRNLLDDALDAYEETLPPEPELDEIEGEEDLEQPDSIRIGVVGRPNVGKSTLVNRMLGEERVVVYDQAGTTRDSVYIPYERHGSHYTLIDTAGVRRRGKVKETVEKFSVIKTLKAVEDAHVAVVVIDAREGLVDQDLHMLGFVLEAGRGTVIAVNKWDGMTAEDKAQVKEQLERKLHFVDFVRIHFISAMHGTGVGNLYEAIEEAYEAATGRWSTNYLTRVLQDAVGEHQPPMVNGHRIKLRFCHMGGMNPPLLIIHGNQTDSVPASYRRYLENTFRRVLKLVGTPVRFEFKSSENPYAGKKNKLTDRQLHKKQRLVRHAKKAEKKKKNKR